MALATVLVDELVRGGVREAVLAPGSRNAPLAFALHEADAAGRLRLHVRIDERSAGFLALGLAKRRSEPVLVTCTSGTAAANLHPAVIEADHAGVPLVILTADRPSELRGTGANQTIDQVRVYGDAPRLVSDLAAAERRLGQNAAWRGLACRTLAAASGSRSGGWPGPVHLNVSFRPPLVPEPGGGDWVESLLGRADGGPWTRTPPAAEMSADSAGPITLPPRTVVVAGDAPAALGRAAAGIAEALGLPLVAEPSSGAWGSRSVLEAGAWMLGDEDFLDKHGPDHLLIFGRPTLGRALARAVTNRRLAVTVVDRRPVWTDPMHAAAEVRGQLLPEDIRHEPDPDWAATWRAADAAASLARDEALAADWPSGQAIARELVTALPAGAALLAGSSNPIRDLDYAAPRRGDLTILSNRGAAGIDGTVSTAIGVALDWQRDGGGPAYALLGDLTLLHDSNGLILGPAEPRPDLTIVVANNDGGAIFGLLEQGGPDHADAFERVFATPHLVDLAALCAATGTPYRRATTAAELAAAVVPAPGIRVVEVPLPRDRDRDRMALLRDVIGDALRDV